MQIESVLAQIRHLQQQTSVAAAPRIQPEAAAGVQGVAGNSNVSFANVLKQGLDKVNAMQGQAADLTTRFERGEPGVDLAQVMIESQKASVAFRATVEVRNRLVNVYQEIMNMPI
jgi:flagellar hook-basal body complex protein FliE